MLDGKVSLQVKRENGRRAMAVGREPGQKQHFDLYRETKLCPEDDDDAETVACSSRDSGVASAMQTRTMRYTTIQIRSSDNHPLTDGPWDMQCDTVSGCNAIQSQNAMRCTQFPRFKHLDADENDAIHGETDQLVAGPWGNADETPRYKTSQIRPCGNYGTWGNADENGAIQDVSDQMHLVPGMGVSSHQEAAVSRCVLVGAAVRDEEVGLRHDAGWDLKYAETRIRMTDANQGCRCTLLRIGPYAVQGSGCMLNRRPL